jgi:hypothetical protein
MQRRTEVSIKEQVYIQNRVIILTSSGGCRCIILNPGAGRIQASARGWAPLASKLKLCGGPCRPRTPPLAAWRPLPREPHSTPANPYPPPPPGSLRRGRPGGLSCSLASAPEGGQIPPRSPAVQVQGSPQKGCGRWVGGCRSRGARRPPPLSQSPRRVRQQTGLARVCRYPQALRIPGWGTHHSLLSQMGRAFHTRVPRRWTIRHHPVQRRNEIPWAPGRAASFSLARKA